MTDDATRMWTLERRTIDVGGLARTVRMTEFRSGWWIASVDTVEGPTLGVDRSPYLALARALDPLGVPLAAALISPLASRR